MRTSWRPRIEMTKALGFICKCVKGNSTYMEYFIKRSHPNIGRICYKEKSPFPRFKWIKDPYGLFSWVEMQRLMTWWHDDMLQCKNKRASTKETHGDHENMEVFWSVGLGALQLRRVLQSCPDPAFKVGGWSPLSQRRISRSSERQDTWPRKSPTGFLLKGK